MYCVYVWNNLCIASIIRGLDVGPLVEEKAADRSVAIAGCRVSFNNAAWNSHTAVFILLLDRIVDIKAPHTYIYIHNFRVRFLYFKCLYNGMCIQCVCMYVYMNGIIYAVYHYLFIAYVAVRSAPLSKSRVHVAV